MQKEHSVHFFWLKFKILAHVNVTCLFLFVLYDKVCGGLLVKKVCCSLLFKFYRVNPLMWCKVHMSKNWICAKVHFEEVSKFFGSLCQTQVCDTDSCKFMNVTHFYFSLLSRHGLAATLMLLVLYWYKLLCQEITCSSITTREFTLWSSRFWGKLWTCSEGTWELLGKGDSQVGAERNHLWVISSEHVGQKCETYMYNILIYKGKLVIWGRSSV